MTYNHNIALKKHLLHTLSKRAPKFTPPPPLVSIHNTMTLVCLLYAGAVLDHDALLEALRTKQIRGAALDVTDPEPLPPGHPLRSCDQVLLTPHWGSQTAETRFTMLRTYVDNLRAALVDNKPMPNEVKL